MIKQEPRPDYHRRIDLERLQKIITEYQLPLLVVYAGRGSGYAVQTADGTPVQQGRFALISAYLTGWAHARALGDETEAAYRLIDASGHVGQAARALLTWLQHGTWHPHHCRCCGRLITDWSSHDPTLPCGELRDALAQLGVTVRAVTLDTPKP